MLPAIHPIRLPNMSFCEFLFPLTPVIPAKAGIQKAASDTRSSLLSSLFPLPPSFPRKRESRGDSGLESRVIYPKSSTNRERKIPSPFMGEG